ncbi:hypothetical protein GF359_03450 [candidate division WOR-3 bacterium]|uniref:Peptidase A2 domain-containing protein n=1 Tax=candidate division WOR-3 bacterium TaxID=2052148 RepID=A0A9D5K8W9_UNCW3|nr:hypothetical protein [candidate division WOR-3 bacterium]MBD3364250.1 hypothetical protein [candidate division WOR-3 bacterium]
MKRLIIISAIILLSGTGFGKDYWSAMKNLDFNEAEAFIKGKEYELDYKKFLWGMQLTVAGDIELASRIMNELAFGSRDSAVAENALTVLGELWFVQNRWSAFNASDTYNREYEDDAFNLVDAFAGAPEEEYVYPETVVRLPIRLSVTGCPIINVKINGKKRRLWLDTGASMTALSSDFAEELGIDALGSATASAQTGTSKKIDVKPALIDSMEIEKIKIRNHPAVILKAEDLEFKQAGITFLRIDGIIGYNALKNLDIEIDYRHKRIRLREPNLKADVERNLFWLGVPIVRLQTEDGTPLMFFFDTGASKTNLFEKISTRIDLGEVREKKALIGSAGGMERIKTRKVSELTLMLNGKQMDIVNLIMVLAPIEPFVNLHGILGADVFAGKILHIDHLNGLIEINTPE